jgi:hypothetical protein
MKCAENRNFADKIKMQEKLNVSRKAASFQPVCFEQIKSYGFDCPF